MIVQILTNSITVNKIDLNKFIEDVVVNSKVFQDNVNQSLKYAIQNSKYSEDEVRKVIIEDYKQVLIKSFNKLYKAIDEKDATTLKNILWYQNKNSIKLFALTLNMPLKNFDTQKSINKIIDELCLP